MTSNSHCIYCHTIFRTPRNYQEHLLNKHAVPTESAFTGKLRRYDLKVTIKRNGFASSHYAKQEGNRCFDTCKGQRGRKQSVISCGSRDDQNSHCK